MPRARDKDIKRLRDSNIGVLMGGVSSERGISLKSGKAVAEALSCAGFNISKIDITSDNPDVIKRILKKCAIDVAFIALHGRFGEDGSVQRLLERLRIVYTGSGPKASRLALDKIGSKAAFKKGGLYTSRHKVLSKKVSLSNHNSSGRKRFSLPVVIKPSREGSSIGLSIIDSYAGFNRALYSAFKYDDKVIVEEYVAGREITVGILADTALPAVEIKPKRRFFDFSAKYKKGLSRYIVPAKLGRLQSAKCRKAALKAHRLLGCDCFSRVDMILDRNARPYILEVNTIPGLTRLSLLPMAAKCAGLTFLDLCIQLLHLAYEKKR